MGVTIHFEGRLKGDKAFICRIKRVEQIATAETLLTEKIENQEVKLLRVRDEESWDYVGPTKGIILYLHEAGEPVRLEFDRDLYIQQWVKGQSTGRRIPMRLTALLRDLQLFFEELEVDDEGQCDIGDEALLTEHRCRCDEAIAQFAKENPTARVKVRESNGRYTDLIT